MCLAVPLLLLEVKDQQGWVDLEGERYSVDLSLLENPRVGDYVILLGGLAVELMSLEEAAPRLELFSRLAGIYERELGVDVALVAKPRGSED